MSASFVQLTTKDFIVGLVAAIGVALLGVFASPVRTRLVTRMKLVLARRRVMKFSTRMYRQGVANFYVGRDDWLRHRQPPDLSDYLRVATSSVEIACYWMAQGTIEGIPRVCGELAEQGIRIEIVMISPDGPMADVLTSDLEIPPEVIRHNVRAGLNHLAEVRAGLSSDARKRFHVKVSRTLPQAAVILIDAGQPSGRLQLEFRPYRAPRWKSFSIELTADTQGALYKLLEGSWSTYFRDAFVYDITAVHGHDGATDSSRSGPEVTS